MSKQRKYNVKFRLDGVLVEVKGVSGKRYNNIGQQMKELEAALANARYICLEKFVGQFKGMTIEHLNGRPRVVGVEADDAWGA